MNELDIALGTHIDTASFIRRNLPEGNFRNIVIKPNWVKHCEHPEFPIEALVTSSRLIDECIQACLEKYRGLEKITVGDGRCNSDRRLERVPPPGISRFACANVFA